MKVYLLTYQWYDDTEVIGIYSTLLKAQLMKSSIEGSNVSSTGDYYIDEMVLE